MRSLAPILVTYDTSTGRPPNSWVRAERCGAQPPEASTTESMAAVRPGAGHTELKITSADPPLTSVLQTCCEWLVCHCYTSCSSKNPMSIRTLAHLRHSVEWCIHRYSPPSTRTRGFPPFAAILSRFYCYHVIVECFPFSLTTVRPVYNSKRVFVVRFFDNVMALVWVAENAGKQERMIVMIFVTKITFKTVQEFPTVSLDFTLSSHCG